jgi:hypothetical protein
VQNPIDAVPAPAPTGWVDLTSDPSGAAIAIDGQPKGTTPQKIKLGVGDHTIAMTLPGRKPFETRIKLGAGATEPVAATLPQLPARLKVTSTPDGATVKVDGVDYGKTPLDRDGLKSKKGATIEVIKPGFQTWKGKVNLEPGATAEVDAPLVEGQRFGYVQISLKEQGIAKVYDEHGKVLGDATRGEGTKIRLPVGHYTLKVSGPQGKNIVPVDIKDGQLTQIKKLELKK